jgi:glycosyltransferase involved in cell wall biosynthesis
MLKILHVLTSPRAEGTPRLVLDWLTVEGYEQHVLFLRPEPGDLLPTFINNCKNIYIENVNYRSVIHRSFGIVKALIKTTRKDKFDLVISWNQGYANWIVLGSRLGGCKKSIVHVGCSPEACKFGYLFDYYIFIPVKLLGGKAVCPSNHIFNTYKELKLFPGSIFRVIPNCINYSRFQKKDPVYTNNFKAILVANLENTKDHKLLIDAWELVIKDIPEAQLSLVGRGSLKEELEQKVIDKKLNNNITFLGVREDVPELLWNHSIFVFSSTKNEGFGTVLIEALSACLKVVAINEPASKEVLKNGEYGILADTRDVTTFAKKIVYAFRNPLLERDINKQQEYAQSFSVENMISKYVSIVSE